MGQYAFMFFQIKGNKKKSSGYMSMIGGFIILSLIISLVFIVILMAYMKEISSLKYQK